MPLNVEALINACIEVVHKTAKMFVAKGIPYQVVGGMAVNIHIQRSEQDEMMLTQDVDVMIFGQDLDRAAKVTSDPEFRKLHLIVTDSIAPEQVTFCGQDVSVIRVADLIVSKLRVFEEVDCVQLRAMDAAGLITPEIEETLPEPLRERLRHVREMR